MKAFHDVIAGSEKWLMQRVLDYARKYGYAAYTSTLPEALRASIAGISAPIIAALRNGEDPLPLMADTDFNADPIAALGVEEAQKHRERGVSFPLFLGLMKYYRQAYSDLLQQAGYPAKEKARCRERLDNFFDRIEIGFSSQWTKLGEAELIRELQKANLQINNEKNKFLTIFESLPNPVLFVNRDRRVSNLNRAASGLFYDGAHPGNYCDRELDIELPQDLASDIVDFSESGKIILSQEKDIVTAAGARRYIAMMQRMLDISGKFNGIVIILNDITHLKELEGEVELLNTDLSERAIQLEKVNRELETFNYSVSHDLRSPLTGISGYCQLLLGPCGELLDEQCTEYIREISRICTRMNNFINMMLDFSRLAKREVKRERIDMSQLAQGIAGGLSLEDRKRSVEFRIADGISAYGDPSLLRAVMENLLGNAWKFTARTESALIEFGATEMGGDMVYFVRDNGIGFDMAQSEKLFIPFQRLEGADEFRGFGVGLASVQRVITRHGGRVWAKGERGGGATIYFTLPARK